MVESTALIVELMYEKPRATKPAELLKLHATQMNTLLNAPFCCFVLETLLHVQEELNDMWTAAQQSFDPSCDEGQSQLAAWAVVEPSPLQASALAKAVAAGAISTAVSATLQTPPPVGRQRQ